MTGRRRPLAFLRDGAADPVIKLQGLAAHGTWGSALSAALLELRDAILGLTMAAKNMSQSEVLLDSVTVTALPASRHVGRKSVEIQNNGPNPIRVSYASGTQYRVLQNKESWALDYDGPLYGIATTADQVTGAATVVTEIW